MSSIWRIWSNPKGDIYVAVRALGGISKMSLHKDGKCQFGFTSEYAGVAKERFGVAQRHLEKWVLPDEPFVRALQILIPESELRGESLPGPNGVTWLQSPPKGSIGTISVLICKPELELEVASNSESGRVLGRLQTSIRSAWITYAFTHLDENCAALSRLRKVDWRLFQRAYQIVRDCGRYCGIPESITTERFSSLLATKRIAA